MRWFLILASLALISVLSLAPSQALGAGEEAPRSGIGVWDTGTSSTTPLAAAVLAGKKDWTAIPADKVVASFKGDAVMTNGRVLAVLRQQDTAADVYSVQADGTVARARLLLMAADGEPAARLQRVALVENTKGAVCLEAAYKTAKGAEMAVKLRIKRGDVAVQAEPGTGAGKLRVECPGRFVVLPDFFADDITIDASKLPHNSADIPSENFVIHLTGQNDAVAMCVFENRQQDVKLTLAGEGAKRTITGSEISFGGKKIWVALMAAPQIWHAFELKATDAGKIVPMDWKMPFVAHWRVDFSRDNDLVDSWDMLLPGKGQGYVKPAAFGEVALTLGESRKRFTESLGDFPYPCWTDQQMRGFVQPLNVKTRTQFVKVLKYQGPVVLYPFNRVAETPPEAFTMVDVARNALGAGPCDYILDLEGHKQQYKGKATCPTQDLLNAIYQNGQQKKRHDEIEKAIADALTFVTHIRGRITVYVEYGQKVRRYLAEQKTAHPELKEQIAELEKIAEEMDARYAERLDRMKTPQHVAQMNEEFRKDVLDAEGPEALERCKKYTDALVKIGGNQDKVICECRWVARTLRQKSGLLVAVDPRMAAIAAEIRTGSQEVLRNPASYERQR